VTGKRTFDETDEHFAQSNLRPNKRARVGEPLPDSPDPKSSAATAGRSVEKTAKKQASEMLDKRYTLHGGSQLENVKSCKGPPNHNADLFESRIVHHPVTLSPPPTPSLKVKTRKLISRPYVFISV
jgi:hypothetical protein